MIKFKSLNRRLHNISFHTHTVSGIVISFALFIIFYAGAIALFRDEIYQWENQNARFEAPEQVAYDEVLATIEDAYPNFKPDGQLSMVFPTEDIPYVQVFGALNETDSTITRFKALVNPLDLAVIKNELPLTTVADTIYHLHFFDQIPGLGIWISGLVSLFFLFAIVTGVLVHWKNIASKFYAFTTKGKWKQIWTNAHTTLGIIGLPFQVVYAVTGALFGLLTLLLAPSAVILFDGDSGPIFESIRPERAIKMDEDAPLSQNKSIDELLYSFETDHPDLEPQNIVFLNYGRADATATITVDDGEGIVADGLFVYRMKTGELLDQIIPNKKTYSQTIYNLLTKLHFGTFGGILLKVVYFILAMITCFMLISGVLIWQTARNNAKYTEKQKRFHHKTTKVYLAICLGLFPATALIFIANKLIPLEVANRAFMVNTAFFVGWLLLILIGLLWNDFGKLNRNYLVLGSALSLVVPICNGVVTGDWVWVALAKGLYQVASVDIAWFFTGAFGLLTVMVLSKKRKRVAKEVTALTT